MPPFLLPVIVKLLETQLVPFLEWAITGAVKLIERRYARKGVPVPARTLQRPTVAAVASQAQTEKAAPEEGTARSA